jgi:hypothetical protein
MNVLLFCPTPEKSNAEQLLRTLHDPADGPDPLNVDLFDEGSSFFSHEDKDYAAIIIFYTPAVELSEFLFEIVRFVDLKRPAGRFFFLPLTGGKEIIPPIFHPIRALQVRLFYYSPSVQSPHALQAQLAAFKEDWRKFIEPAPLAQPGRYGAGRGSRQAGFGLILLASIFILFLVGLITVLIPTAQKTILPPTPTSLHPPAAAAFWLQESFQNSNMTTRWQTQHYYSGKQALQTKFSSAGLRLFASPVVTDAVFQLDSLQTWPLDELQSLSFSFAMSALDDPAAKNALIFGLTLSEDNSYRLDCLIVPAKTDGRIQCQVQSPAQTVALSEAIPFSLSTQHTVTLVFDPLNYSLQFFLDNQYYGQREIQYVEYWRAREFNLQIRAETQNLNSGSFSCELYSLDLAHQP